MLTKFRPRLTYANVMASIALFVALGGTSYAAVSLSSGSVRKQHIASNAVGKSEIRKNAVGKAEIETLGVGKSEIRANAVGNSEVKPDSLRGEEILESSLAEVPSAAKLQGKAAADFLSSKARIAAVTSDPVTPTTRATATAACETTERAISGGGAWVNAADGGAIEDADTTLIATQPVLSTGQEPEATGWQVEGRSGATAGRALRAFAVCVPRTP